MCNVRLWKVGCGCGSSIYGGSRIYGESGFGRLSSFSSNKLTDCWKKRTESKQRESIFKAQESKFYCGFYQKTEVQLLGTVLVIYSRPSLSFENPYERRNRVESFGTLARICSSCAA